MAPPGQKNDDDKGVAEVIGDLWELVREYARQETIDPLKSIGRFVGYGVAGAAALSLGLLFVSLAVLRLLQTETEAHLTGSWNWVPYLVTVVIDTIVVLLAVRAIKKPVRDAGAPT
ncbi:MAG: hypothetical protein ACR2MB_10180 [Acidimicrobiales bacterium]